MPSVDIFVEGFLAGAIVASLAVYRMHLSELRRIERRRAFGLRHHPAFRSDEQTPRHVRGSGS